MKGRCSQPMLTGTAAVVLLLASALGACDPTPSGPAPAPSPAPAPTYDPNWEATQSPARRLKHVDAAAPTRRKVDARPVVPVEPSPDDPRHGDWSLEEALVGLPPGDRLVATIRTDVGELRCTLWPERAPIAVANFVGLARGLRPWKTPGGTWQKRPAYDGSSFSRVVPGVLAQGGSPDGGRDTGPGYFIPDEIWEDANHDLPGLLCVASLGKNKGGMQFAITLGAAYHLDGSFPIFGQCAPLALVQRIAALPGERARLRKPLRIESVRIGRER